MAEQSDEHGQKVTLKIPNDMHARIRKLAEARTPFAARPPIAAVTTELLELGLAVLEGRTVEPSRELAAVARAGNRHARKLRELNAARAPKKPH